MALFCIAQTRTQTLLSAVSSEHVAGQVAALALLRDPAPSVRSAAAAVVARAPASLSRDVLFDACCIALAPADHDETGGATAPAAPTPAAAVEPAAGAGTETGTGTGAGTGAGTRTKPGTGTGTGTGGAHAPVLQAVGPTDDNCLPHDTPLAVTAAAVCALLSADGAEADDAIGRWAPRLAHAAAERVVQLAAPLEPSCPSLPLADFLRHPTVRATEVAHVRAVVEAVAAAVPGATLVDALDVMSGRFGPAARCADDARRWAALLATDSTRPELSWACDMVLAHAVRVRIADMAEATARRRVARALLCTVATSLSVPPTLAQLPPYDVTTVPPPIRAADVAAAFAAPAQARCDVDAVLAMPPRLWHRVPGGVQNHAPSRWWHLRAFQFCGVAAAAVAVASAATEPTTVLTCGSVADGRVQTAAERSLVDAPSVDDAVVVARVCAVLAPCQPWAWPDAVALATAAAECTSAVAPDAVQPCSHVWATAVLPWCRAQLRDKDACRPVHRFVAAWAVTRAEYPHVAGRVLGHSLPLTFQLMDAGDSVTEFMGVSCLWHVLRQALPTNVRPHAPIVTEVAGRSLASNKDVVLGVLLQATLQSLPALHGPAPGDAYDSAWEAVVQKFVLQRSATMQHAFFRGAAAFAYGAGVHMVRHLGTVLELCEGAIVAGTRPFVCHAALHFLTVVCIGCWPRLAADASFRERVRRLLSLARQDAEDWTPYWLAAVGGCVDALRTVLAGVSVPAV